MITKCQEVTNQPNMHSMNTEQTLESWACKCLSCALKPREIRLCDKVHREVDRHERKDFPKRSRSLAEPEITEDSAGPIHDLGLL